MIVRYPKTNYVVFDFETTGLDPELSDVIQMSAIKFTGDKKEAFNAFVQTDVLLPDLIKNLTGITDEMLKKEGRKKEDAWKEFNEFISGHILIGHNSINFDRLFLEKNYTHLGYKIPSPHMYIDTAMLYKATKLDEGPKYYETHFDFCKRISQIRAFGIKYKLTLCCEELGIDISQFTAHRSDSDIEMTNLIYQKFIGKFVEAGSK